MKNCLGIEIGHYRIKIAYMERGELKKYVSERLDIENLTDIKLYAEFIRDVLRENDIRCRKAVFVLRQDDTYVKRCHLPLMTVEQLKLNLPFEFHDYIGEQLDEYQFDYAVIERTEEHLDLLAAACKKELCGQFKRLAKLAKLKLVGLVPAVVGLERILEHMREENEEDGGEDSENTVKDYAILDLGTKTLCMHFFRKGVYDITRTMEPGCEEIEKLHRGDKDKLAELNVDADEDFWSEESEKKLNAALEEQYQNIAVQIMRVLNFYSFNNADNTIDSLYYCGGGARYKALIDALGNTVGIPVKSMDEMLPEAEEEELPDWLDSPQTIGVLLG